MTDRTTKLLLLAIALGLWANVATRWIQPVPLRAQATSEAVLEIKQLHVDLLGIGADLVGIAGGTCLNPKICK